MRQLLKRDFRVHALVHRRPLPIDDARITIFQGELDDCAALYPAMERATAAINLVGIIRENPASNTTFGRMHVGFTRAVVGACIRHNVLRYIHMSALGSRPDSPSLYHQTKAAGEAMVKTSSLSWTIMRPSVVHGADGEFTRALASWSRGKSAPWLFMPYFGAGLLGRGRKYLVQPVWVEDLARLFVDAIEAPATVGKQYDVVGDQTLTWPEMYSTFSRQLTGKSKPTMAIPAWYARGLTRIVPAKMLPFNRAQVLMSQEESVADLEPIERDFGFRPEGFEASVTRYIKQLD